MRRIILLGGLLFCMLTSQAVADKRVALVIGNGQYQSVRALADAKADAIAVGQLFRDAGFDSVEVWTDLTLRELERTLAGFAKTADGADVAIIYYAGHAFAIDGTNYVIPVDATLDNYYDAMAETVTLPRMLAAMSGAKTLKLGILDANRDNTFVSRMRPDAIHGITGWTTLKVPELPDGDTLVAYATQAGSLAVASNGRSLLADALVKNLPVPGRDLRFAFGFVIADVLSQSGGSQRPYVFGSIHAAYLPLVPATATKPESSSEEAAEYDLAVKINTAAAWQVFLGGHPAGSYSDLAREKLASIIQPGSERAAPSSPSVPTPRERRVALVIGNSAYKAVPELPNPRRDAQLIADALKKLGFEKVVLANDLAREAMIAVLRSFASDADKADWALIYYAGHGLEAGGINYMIPVDARLVTDRDVQYEAVPLDQVMSATEGARKLRLVLLDACRNNPFANRIVRTTASRGIGRGLAQVEPDVGTLVVFAAKDGQVALDGDGQFGPFAQALAKNLPMPGVEINKFFRLVRDDVMDATGRQQQPFVYGSVTGREDFYFTPPAGAAAAPQPSKQ
jgi:uncharacterized caspase-like protein